MKRLLTILGASLFLVGCGSQNLGPLEDKTTNLRDENHNLKLKIQQLNQDINNQKSQQDLQNGKKIFHKVKLQFFVVQILLLINFVLCRIIRNFLKNL